MKNRIAYSLRLEKEDSMVLKISTGDATPYHFEGVETFDATKRQGSPMLQELAQPNSRVLQHIDMDEVHLQLTVLPPMKPKALVAALQGTVAREEGGKPGDWIVRHTKLKRQPDSRTTGQEISMVSAPVELLERLFADAVELGSHPQGMLSDFLALEDLYRRHGLQEGDEGAWSLVYLGPKVRFLCVGDEECLLFERPLPEDFSGGDSPEEYLDHLITEIERSNSFAQQAEHTMHIQRIVICGDPVLGERLHKKLSEASDIEVRHWLPQELFSRDEGVEAWPYTLDLARAVAAMQGCRYELLPPGVKKGPGKVIGRHALIALATLVGAIVPSLFLGATLTSRVQDRYFESASVQLEHLSGRAQLAATSYMQNRSLSSRQENVQRLAEAQPDLTRVLEDVASRTPHSVILARLEFRRLPEEGLQLVLAGESRGIDAAEAQQLYMDYLSSLAKSSCLQATGDPLFSEIEGISEGTTPQTRVAFTLEYLIKEVRE